MFAKLFLLFVVVPLLELALLIRVGTLMGFWPTVALVLVTGALGAWLARQQGLIVLKQIRASLQVGQVPASHLLDGLFVLIGGVLLLTPGLMTDIIGMLLMVPFTRSRLKKVLRRRLERMVRSGQISFTMMMR